MADFWDKVNQKTPRVIILMITGIKLPGRDMD